MAKQPFSELKRGLIPYLEQGHEVTVSELGYAFKGSSAKITAHLTDLVDRGILQRRKDGRTYVYFLAMSRRSNPTKGQSRADRMAYSQWAALLEMRRRVEAFMERARSAYAYPEYEGEDDDALERLAEAEQAWEWKSAEDLLNMGALGDIASADSTGKQLYARYVATTEIGQDWPPLWDWRADEYPHRHENPSDKYHEVTATSTGRYNGGAATKRQYGSSTVTIFTIDDPTAPGGQRYHKYEGRGATPGERRTAALQAHAARFGITKPVKHVSGKKAREMRIAASTDRPDVGSAPEGYHQIAEAEGPRNVKTVYRKGLYFVHAGTNRGNNKASYTLTHGPTGMAIGVFSTKVNASAAARHFDNVARDAGRSARFGSRPSDSAFDTLRDAFKSLPSKLLK